MRGEAWAEGLVDLADVLSLLRLRAERLNGGLVRKLMTVPANERRQVVERAQNPL